MRSPFYLVIVLLLLGSAPGWAAPESKWSYENGRMTENDLTEGEDDIDNDEFHYWTQRSTFTESVAPELYYQLDEELVRRNYNEFSLRDFTQQKYNLTMKHPMVIGPDRWRIGSDLLFVYKDFEKNERSTYQRHRMLLNPVWIKKNGEMLSLSAGWDSFRFPVNPSSDRDKFPFGGEWTRRWLDESWKTDVRIRQTVDNRAGGVQTHVQREERFSLEKRMDQPGWKHWQIYWLREDRDTLQNLDRVDDFNFTRTEWGVQSIHPVTADWMTTYAYRNLRRDYDILNRDYRGYLISAESDWTLRKIPDLWKWKLRAEHKVLDYPQQELLDLSRQTVESSWRYEVFKDWALEPGLRWSGYQFPHNQDRQKGDWGGRLLFEKYLPRWDSKFSLSYSMRIQELKSRPDRMLEAGQIIWTKKW